MLSCHKEIVYLWRVAVSHVVIVAQIPLGSSQKPLRSSLYVHIGHFNVQQYKLVTTSNREILVREIQVKALVVMAVTGKNVVHTLTSARYNFKFSTATHTAIHGNGWVVCRKVVVDVKTNILQGNGKRLCRAAFLVESVIVHKLRINHFIQCACSLTLNTCRLQVLCGHACHGRIDFLLFSATVKEYRCFTDAKCFNVFAVNVRVYGFIGERRKHQMVYSHVVRNKIRIFLVGFRKLVFVYISSEISLHTINHNRCKLA